MIRGNYAEAKVYSEDAENYAKAQIKMICDDPVSEGSAIAVMPDVHPGAIGPIGLSMTVGEKVNSNLVGSDIGCGVHVAKIDASRIDFQKLTKVIVENIPSGSAVRDKPHNYVERFDFNAVEAFGNIKKDRAMLALGTLGGGNHFIEVDEDSEGGYYLAIHSGSRSFGSQVSEYYNKVGYEYLRSRGIEVPFEMTYLEGALRDAYLHDQALLCEFAYLNRRAIAIQIAKKMKWKLADMDDSLDCCHNYIDMGDKVPMLRKGAISALKNERVAIPLNMRDGTIVGRGRGNQDWNFTAPHGAGRILSRNDVKSKHTVNEFRKAMEGINSPSIGAGTLDEAPFAYREPAIIEAAIKDTVEVESILKPLFNFKAGNEDSKRNGFKHSMDGSRKQPHRKKADRKHNGR